MTPKGAFLPAFMLNKVIGRALGFRAVGERRWERGVRGTPEFATHWPGPHPYAQSFSLGQQALQQLLTPEQQQGIYLRCLAFLIPEWSGAALPARLSDDDGWRAGIDNAALLAFAQADSLTRARALVMALNWLKERP